MDKISHETSAHHELIGESGHSVPFNNHSDHDHHQMMIEDFRKRFYITLLLTIPVMILSPMIQHFAGFEFHFPGMGYVVLLLSSVIYFYGGNPFLKGSLEEISNRKPGMMTLVAIAITVAYVYSIATVLGLPGMDFFWELCTLILIMLLGHWIEMKSIAGATKDLQLLVKLMPSHAHLIKGDIITDVHTDSLKEGELVLIRPGEKIPADGVIIDGESYVNESMLTGESVPVKKIVNDKVISGAVNGSGALKVKVLHPSKESYLAQVVKLVENAQKEKSRTQLLADRAAGILTFVALAAGLITFIAWLMISEQPLFFAIERMVTVIVICCPHALGLAIPLVIAVSTSVSAKNGLLIKDRTEFENSRKVTTVLFDKTGTLTYGKLEVTGVSRLKNDVSEEEILVTAAALEIKSEHPIASGIIAYVKNMNLKIPEAQEFISISGTGVKGKLNGQDVKVVSPGYLKENKIPYDEKRNDEIGTRVFVIVDDNLWGYITLADKIRAESFDAIELLHKNKIKSYLLTGDNTFIAKSVCDKLNMDGYFAEVLPHEKLEKVKELQSRGEVVAMTGDGVNDAPALAQADVGIAIGSGSDIAADTAGIILVNSNPNDVVKLILFGKITYKKMIQNLVWATGYNVIAIPLAAGILYSWEILLSPAAGAALMSLSTVIVAINAKMLKF